MEHGAERDDTDRDPPVDRGVDDAEVGQQQAELEAENAGDVERRSSILQEAEVVDVLRRQVIEVQKTQAPFRLWVGRQRRCDDGGKGTYGWR